MRAAPLGGTIQAHPMSLERAMHRLFIAATLAALAATAQAEPASTRRLQIEVEVLREADFSGVERGHARLVQRLSVQVLLRGDGTPMVNNPLDPDDARRQYDSAQRRQQRMSAALTAAGQTAAPSVPTDPQALQALQTRA